MKTYQEHIPNNALAFVEKWVHNYPLVIKVSRERKSKLGDYRKYNNTNHEITVNSDLDPQLFFFVLTHEIAHLIAFENYGNRILAHGKEWKFVFRNLILESLSIYSEDLIPFLVEFSKSPKANFTSCTNLVRYFYPINTNDCQFFVEDLSAGTIFKYKDEKYKVLSKLKKNYLCIHMNSGKKYAFKPLVKIDKTH